MKILKSNNDYKFLFQIMESQLNYIAEKEEPWKGRPIWMDWTPNLERVSS